MFRVVILTFLKTTEYSQTCIKRSPSIKRSLVKILKITSLRAIASKYGESHDSSENSDFFLLRQKDPFGELFSEIRSSDFTFL